MCIFYTANYSDIYERILFIINSIVKWSKFKHIELSIHVELKPKHQNEKKSGISCDVWKNE